MILHEVRVVFEPIGRSPVAALCERIDLVCDMLELADPFSLELPFTRKLWDACPTDTQVSIHIDDSRVLTGFIDERVKTGSKSRGSTIRLEGRDKGGRLVDESAPLVTFAGLGIEDLAREIVAPWFNTVSLSNARNRALVKGRGRRSAAIAREPAIQSGKDVRRKVDPGETRAQVLLYFLELAGLLAWSTADGREFIVGEPNYSQAPQWRFQVGDEASNVEEHDYRESVAERYSSVTVCGSSRGNGQNYAGNIFKQATIHDNGGDFQRPKVLIVSDHDVNSVEKAQDRAIREKELRDARGRALSLTVPGFGQVLGGVDGERPAIYAFDTVARWEDVEADIRGDFLITRVHFQTDKNGGQWTQLDLVPVGTELRAR